jgi:hypothetical protein
MFYTVIHYNPERLNPTPLFSGNLTTFLGVLESGDIYDWDKIN